MNMNTKQTNSGKSKTSSIGYWDKALNKGESKVGFNQKYRVELDLIRKEFGNDVMTDLVFGRETEQTKALRAELDEVRQDFLGKLPEDSLNESGTEYVYTEEELQGIKKYRLQNLH